MENWSIVKTGPGGRRLQPSGQLVVHIPEQPWVVVHPRRVKGLAREITRHASHAEALAFVLDGGVQDAIRRGRRITWPPQMRSKKVQTA